MGGGQGEGAGRRREGREGRGERCGGGGDCGGGCIGGGGGGGGRIMGEVFCPEQNLRRLCCSRPEITLCG